ncbi:MAG: hypothetical protein H6734_10315 [Alphaproteobacteria bacterium]|nr:hypothetical protein [Alphaproteobacteria bacterium]
MRPRSRSLQSLVRDNPWAEEVLDWHGLSVDQVDPTMSLGTAAWLFGRDIRQIEADLDAASSLAIADDSFEAFEVFSVAS